MRSVFPTLKPVFCALVCIVVSSAVIPAAASSSTPVQQLIRQLRSDPDALNVARQAILRRAGQEGRILGEGDLTRNEVLRLVATSPDVAISVAKALASRQNSSSANSTPPPDVDVATSAPVTSLTVALAAL